MKEYYTGIDDPKRAYVNIVDIVNEDEIKA